jgi:diaminopimelate epimerase
VSRAFAVSGGGNDFLALVEPERDPTAAEIAAWCARGVSLGADGVFALRRTPAGAALRYWNADGRQAALCVNATRCAARLALELGWGEGEIVVATGAGAISARRTAPTEIALGLPPPERRPERRAPAVAWPALEGTTIGGWFLEVGVPHFVVPWPESLAGCPVATLGAALRHHAGFAPAGTNVDFVRRVDRHRLEIRSFERGVEAETLACGTGVLAATAAGLATGDLALPVVALTRGGFELAVAGEVDGGFPLRWTLAGDARILAALEPTPEAALSPPPAPRWSD